MTIETFKVGDRVHHIGRKEDGTIIRVGDRVLVEFDNPTPRGARSIGEFDELWFKTHHGWLQPLNQQ